MRWFRVFISLGVAIGLAVGVGVPTAPAAPPPAYFVDGSKLPFDALPAMTTSRLWGVHNGAGYRIEVPANWNGELVLYAHGFRGTGLELTVTNPSIRGYLVGHGFAWAASSYSKNGYDVAQGVKDTHALGALFRGLVGNPTRTYLMGHSMGGHITGVAIEQYPDAYVGALPMCGVMGDVELFDYFLDYNLLAEALAQWPAQFPAPADYLTTVVPAVKTALATSFPDGLNAQGEKLKAATELLTGGVRPTFDLGWTVWNANDFLFGLGVGDGTVGVAPGVVAGNTDTTYQLDDDPALNSDEVALNDAVLRVAKDPQGVHPDGLANIPVVQGTPSTPVISLHTLGDLFVPFSMEQIYARRVAAHGVSDLLVSRAIRDVGHCGFTTAEQEAAFADLVSWVEHGVTPAGDNILTPSVVAAPTFGCRFTLTNRPYAPCPQPQPTCCILGATYPEAAPEQIATSVYATSTRRSARSPLPFHRTPLRRDGESGDTGGGWNPIRRSVRPVHSPRDRARVRRAPHWRRLGNARSVRIARAPLARDRVTGRCPRAAVLRRSRTSASRR